MGIEIEEVEITIDEKGNVQIHVRGVKGEKCLTLTEDLSEALGADLIDQNLTPEMYEQDLPMDLPNRVEQKNRK